MRPALERRVRQARSRALVRAWEYRQRNHARGAWFRRLGTDLLAAEHLVLVPFDGGEAQPQAR